MLLWQQMVRLVLLYDPNRDNLAVHLLVCGLAVEAAKVMVGGWADGWVGDMWPRVGRRVAPGRQA